MPSSPSVLVFIFFPFPGLWLTAAQTRCVPCTAIPECHPPRPRQEPCPPSGLWLDWPRKRESPFCGARSQARLPHCFLLLLEAELFEAGVPGLAHF